MNKIIKYSLTAMLSFLLLASAVNATPITITGQLTGDIRDANPNGLIVDVTITSDTTSNVASWTIDINSLLHPGIKLDEFYFNVTGASSDYSFGNFDPIGWAVDSPASVQGAGGTTFLFETLDLSGSPNADDVTNDQNLTFDMTLLGGGFFTEAIFLDAVDAISNDAGSGQMGAHLQSLTLNNQGDLATEDSGFAFGNYVGDGGGGQQQIPEPNIIALLGMGLLGIGLSNFRRKRKTS